MSHSVEEVQKHVKIYITVFVALMVLTIVTVAVSYLDLSVGAAIALALFIASIKGALVACYFMHLISEKAIIIYSLLITCFFFIVCLLLPVITGLDTFAL